MKLKFTLIAISLSLISCDKAEYQTHEKGFEYLFFEQNLSAPKPRVGDIMILKMDYFLNGDSLLFSSSELNYPFRMKLKRNEPNGETIDDALSLLHTGDSASFKVNANLFYTLTQKQDVPIEIKQTDLIVFYVKLVKVIDYETFQKENTSTEIETPEQEEALLKHYLESANIKIEPSNSGLYFIEDIAGKGPKAQIGHQVTIHYSGYFVDGKPFSSTYNAGRPFKFTLGKDDLIIGFQEGISQMQAKGRYTLIIPSFLAYGKEGNAMIPPNKTLIFEIDVLKIE